jgi:addiction module HigA family antidote
MIPKHRPPTTPGEILLEEFLKPRRMSQSALAERMGIPIQRVNTIINGRRAVTAGTALLLAKMLKTSPEFWLDLQMQCDLWSAQHSRHAG